MTAFSEHGPGVFAFLTCEPNSLVAPIYPKAMPLILDDEGEERWLAGELVAPFPAQFMAVALAAPTLLTEPPPLLC